MSFELLLGAVDAGYSIEIDGRTYVPVLVGASGIVQVAETAPLTTIAVTQSTPDSLRTGIYGRYSGAWQRQSLVWGFDSTYETSISTVGAAGTNTINLATLGANQVAVVTHFFAVDLTSALTGVQMGLIRGGGLYRLHHVGAVAAAITTVPPGPIHLFNGDNLRVSYFGVTVNDVIRTGAIGYIMTLNK